MLKSVFITETTEIVFDKEKTQEHRTMFNESCNCQDCLNYYKNIEKNAELVEFLADFGVDYKRTEEVYSFEDESDDGYIHSIGYYSVEVAINGDNVSVEKFGVKISFTYDEYVPTDRKEGFFWITIDAEFPYVLEQKRERHSNANSNDKYDLRKLEKSRSKIAILIIVSLFVFSGIITVIGMKMEFNRRKETEEYKLAYSYLINCETFKTMNVAETEIRFTTYSRSGVQHNNSETTERKYCFGFKVDDKTFEIVCHQNKDEWYVCEECTYF